LDECLYKDRVQKSDPKRKKNHPDRSDNDHFLRTAAVQLTLGNGMASQVLAKYRIFQSGDVTAAWDSIMEYEVTDPSRLHFSKYDNRKHEQTLKK
jgi:hypothetical protein